MSAYSDLIIADGATAYLRLGEPSGTAAADACGGPSWTYKNTPTLGVTGALVGDSNTAITCAAASFEDVNLASVPMTVVDNWTLEAWVMPSATQLETPVSIVYIGDVADGYGMCLVTGLYPRGFRNGGGGITDAPASPLSTSSWSYLVLRRSSGVASMWVNGVRADPNTNNTDAPAIPTAKSCIGAFRDGSWFYNGSIDEVAIYNTALSDAKILSHYTAGVTASTDIMLPMGMIVR